MRNAFVIDANYSVILHSTLRAPPAQQAFGISARYSSDQSVAAHSPMAIV